MQSQEETGKKRIRASVACSYCRSKRSKCDGIPGMRACGQCQLRGVECEINQGKRNRGHYKPQAEALLRRVQTLERELEKSRAMNPVLTTSAPLNFQDKANADYATEGESGATPCPDLFFQSTMRPGPHKAETDSVFLEQANSESYRNDRMTLGDTRRTSTEGLFDMGFALASPTSNSNKAPQSTMQPSPPRYDAQSTFTGQTAVSEESVYHVDNRLENFAELRLTSSVVDYLLGLFFHRYQLMLKFLSQRDFMARRAVIAKSELRPALTLAMLSAGLRYSTRQEVTEAFINPKGENLLAIAAKAALEHELRSRDIATVQTLLILGEVETSSGNEMTGHMYSTMASKLIFELSLVLGYSTTTTLTDEEVEVRNWLLWATSVQDQYWAISLRHPLTIKSQFLKMSRVAVSARIRSVDEQDPSPNFKLQVNDSILDLMEISREIADDLFDPAAKQDATAISSKISNLDLKLDGWFEKLPEKMQTGPVSGQESYHFLFVMHFTFHAAKIILHRDFAFEAEFCDQGSPNAPSFNDSAKQPSRDAVVLSATRIAKLFESFRRRDDIRSLQCTGVQWATIASEVLISHIALLPPDEIVESIAHLQSLSRTLKEMSKTFNPAARQYGHVAERLDSFLRNLYGEASPLEEVSPQERFWSGNTTDMAEMQPSQTGTKSLPQEERAWLSSNSIDVSQTASMHSAIMDLPWAKQMRPRPNSESLYPPNLAESHNDFVDSQAPWPDMWISHKYLS